MKAEITYRVLRTSIKFFRVQMIHSYIILCIYIILINLYQIYIIKNILFKMFFYNDFNINYVILIQIYENNVDT